MAYIVKQKGRNNRVAVCLAVNAYDPEKRQARQRRTYLGVYDEKTGELLLGRNCPEPDAATIALLAQKKIKYLGNKADPPGRKPTGWKKGKTASIFSGPDGRDFEIVEVGRMRVLTALAEKSGLTQALRVAFGAEDGGRLLSLAIHQVCEQEALYLAESWLEETGTPTAKGFSKSSLNRLLGKVGTNENARAMFLRAWIKQNGKPASLIHDTTSLSTCAEVLTDAEWGDNGNREKRPLINLALVMGRDDGLPLWYRAIPGSVPDVSTLTLTKKLLAEYGLSEAEYSLDRGYYNKANIIKLLKGEADFTIGVPFSNEQSKRIARENLNALKTVQRSFIYAGERLRHVLCDYEIELEKGKSMVLPAHLYLNPQCREECLARLEKTVLELETQAARREFNCAQDAWNWVADNARWMSNLLTVSTRKGKIRIIRKPNAIPQAARHFGLTLILTSKKQATREETLASYRCRDAVEKLFDVYKNATGNKRLRCSKDDSAAGRIFLAFLSVTLDSLLAAKLRSSKMEKTHSVREVLAALRKVKQFKTPIGRRHQMEVPGKTRLILKGMGLANLFGS